MVDNQAQRNVAIVGLVLGWGVISAAADIRSVPGSYPTIQAAIDDAANGDVVEVADGVYTGPGNRDINFGGKAITVRSASGNPAACIIDCGGSAAEHHRAFLFNSGEAPASVLEGFTIRNGYMNRGGAVMCQSGVSGPSSPTIRNCVFRQNIAWAIANGDGGGAIYLDGSHPSLSDCEFVENHAELTVDFTIGGALAMSVGSSPAVRNCDFVRNSASGAGTVGGGGAVSIGRTGANPAFTNCTFVENTCSSEGGAVRSITSGTAVFIDCLFLRNSQTTPGLGGGGAFVAGSPDLTGHTTLLRCTFAENQSARIGAAVWVLDGQYEIRDCSFLGNAAGDRAGGLAASRGAQVSVANCRFVGNSSGRLSGLGVAALDCFDGIGSASGVAMTGCTFSHNVAPPSFAAVGAWQTSTLDGSSCIFWDNQPVAFIQNGRTTLNYSSFGVAPPPVGAGNIVANPALVRDPSDGGDGWHDDPNTPADERANNDYGDLRLTAASPCIDAGDPAFLPAPCEHDLDGACRVWEAASAGEPRVDMGAYEHGSPLGDLDGNCAVDLSDLATLLAHFGTATGATYSDGDVDRDGDVDLSDLARLLASFGATCP